MRKIAKTLLGGILTLVLVLGLMPAVNVQADDASYITIHYYADTTQSAVYAYAGSATWNESGWYDWNSISGYESYFTGTGVEIYQNAYNTGWYDVTLETTNVGAYLALIFTDGNWGSYQFGNLLVDPTQTEVWITCDWNTSYADDYARLYIDSSYATAPEGWDDGSSSGYVLSLAPSATSVTIGETATVTATILYNGEETALSDDMKLSWKFDNTTEDTASGLTDGTLASEDGTLYVDCSMPSVGTYYVCATLTVGDDTYTAYTAITTKEAASYDTTTVYYDNTNSAWDSVYLYMADSSWAALEGYEDYATWPGVELTANSDGLYEAEIPDSVDVYLIFSDGTGGSAGETQTENLLHETGDGEQTYEIASSGESDDEDDSSTTSVNSNEGVATVYFTNTQRWESVYVYIMDSSWSSIEGYEDYATWPGVQLTANSDGLYEVTIPDNMDVYLIFSDGTGGAGGQTIDLLHEAGTGDVTYNADGSDIKTAEDESTDSTSNKKTGDATPLIPVAVALLGCAVIAVSSRRRAA